ncbi:MAG: Hpt domain-containing protein, partial [Vibrionaceae bacterium]|nr:Hpt domain-containing protein [Vibrionaceae bacterium]
SVLSKGLSDKKELKLHTNQQDTHSETRLFSPDIAISRMGGNKRVYLKLLQQFLTELTHISAAMKQVENQPDRMADLLHDFAGTSATAGADALSLSCKNAEQQVRNREVGSTYKHDIERLKERTLIKVEAYLKKEAN